MNTRVLMIVSAAIMAVTGILLTFIPDELFKWLTGELAGNPLILQMLGALYFGFAMLNWMARGNLIGGIYSRPVAIANLTHFFIGGLAILKSSGNMNSAITWIGGLVYLLMATLFCIVVYTSPVKALK